VKSPPKFNKQSASMFIPFLLQIPASLTLSSKLGKIAWFFTKAGAFVFGSGLAIVPFLYGGVVKDYKWLTEQQFLDAVAVAMITPGPVVITVGFIGYLVGGLSGACVAALATFIPCYLFTVIPAPYFKKYGKHTAIKAFVDGVTAAAIGAIAGAVIVLAKRQFVDAITIGIAIVAAFVLFKFKKIQEPYIIAIAAIIGLILKLVIKI
jgi:chromate transporter